MALLAQQHVVHLDKRLLKCQAVVSILVIFILHQNVWKESVAEYGHEFTSMAIVHCEQRIAVAEVKNVRMCILVTLPPTLHTASTELHFVIFAIGRIFFRNWSRQKVSH